MKFQRLRLTGFKSFVDPTDLLIEPGLTGIVGPNGCGKSNLLEALRWVMGENSFKNMRGSGMEDVIFAGSDKRPTRNHAEVVLLLDNAARQAPAAYNEFESIEVTRRITRDAGSSYKVNGRDVRARDVQLLFADASTGSHSPALVSQGKIGQLIASKPINRRRILEEAAGITGLYTRRHEAELRLRSAESNLTRLDDVMGQMETQLNSLKRQARQATRYRNISRQIRESEAILLHLRWKLAAETLAAEEKRLAETDALVLNVSKEAALASNADAKARDVLPALREEEAKSAARLHRLTVERDGLDAEEKRAGEEAQRLEQRLAQIVQDLAREKALIADMSSALERLDREEADLTDAALGEEETQAQAEQAVAEAREKVTEREADLDGITRQLAKLEAERQSLARAAHGAMARVERLTREHQTLEQEQEGAPSVSAAEAVVNDARERLEQVQAELMAAEEAVNEAEVARRQAQSAEETAREPMQEAERRAAALATETNTLASLLDRGNAADHVPVIDEMSASSGYETALGAALGDDLDVGRDEDAALHWQTLDAYPDAPALPHGVAPLSRFVQAPAALARRLSQIGVVESPEQGAALFASLRPGQRLVTREGALWRWDGLVQAADAPTPAARRLAQRNRLYELEAELDEAQSVADERREAFEAARARNRQAAEAETVARNRQRDAQKADMQARDAVARAEKEAGAQLAKLNSLRDQTARVARELEEAQGAATEAREALEGLAPDEELKAEAADLREQVARLRSDLSQVTATYDGLKREADARGRRLAAIVEERKAWATRQENAERQIAALTEREEEAREERERLAEIPEQVAEKRDALMVQIREAETARKEASDRLAEAESEAGEQSRRLREAESQLATAREERARLSGLVEGAKERVQETEGRIRETLNSAPDRALSSVGIDPEAELPPADQVERQLEGLKRDRDSLGGVNLRADEESVEISTELDKMTSEREDLVAAISKLRQGIASLNREGRERMLAAFEKVNENFTRLFTHLFGGGEAHLKLTESDDPLEAGLEIMARPPGKRLQVMSLLSGGEQALTAMALIFAVFLTNPSPICVLDEVDAPLDDANTERFCELMEEMVRETETRFLVITHHALTMSRMNRLFGVTMQERGVSTLVSVDLDRAEQLLEAG